MKSTDATNPFYMHPRSRWFDAKPRDRFPAELMMTYAAFGTEFGQDHPMTLVAGSWAAVGHCYLYESWSLDVLTAAEPVLRLTAANSPYALACNLAARGFGHVMFDSGGAIALFEEALQHAQGCSEIHPMDVLKIVEVLAEHLNEDGRRKQAIDHLRSYEMEITRGFVEFPNECYDLLGLWVEYVGDAQIEARASGANPQSGSHRSAHDRVVTQAVVALTRAARKAFLDSDKKAAHCHFRSAVATLMASPKLCANRGGALASMLATQAANQHPTQGFYVRYG